MIPHRGLPFRLGRALPTLGFIAGVSFAMTVLPARPAPAVTKLEGEYQLMLDVRKTGRDFNWDWNSNNNDNYTGLNLWLLSTPRRNTEVFFKTEAEWRDPENNAARPNFQFKQAHARYLWERRPGAPNVEALAFFRQDRYWVDNYLIRIVDPGILKQDFWGENGSGIRVDTRNWKGLSTSWIVSDFANDYNPAAGTGSPEQTDDAFIARIRREQFRRNLRLGATYNRRHEDGPNEPPQSATVFGLDSRYMSGGIDYSLEYSWSRSQRRFAEVKYPDALDGLLPDNAVLTAEIRAFRFGNSRTGYLNVAPTGWFRGALYENRLGDDTHDEAGYNINAWYLVPERAVTLTANYRNYQKQVTDKRREQELYGELYVEFVNGFTGKAFYRTRDIDRLDPIRPNRFILDEYDDIYAEVQVESRLAWLRGGFKIKNVGQSQQKELASIELSINATDKTKVYTRFAFGNDASVLRKAVFAELQYRPTGNMEMFLQYGPSWIGDSTPPVDDGDLEARDQEDLVKFILKGRF